ncbi:MAG: hypothetical protein Q9228_001084 [Teloschistes exilis]
MHNNAQTIKSILCSRPAVTPPYIPLAYGFSRLISTNSAIRKGLRKAQRGRSRLDPPSQASGRTWRSSDDKDIGPSRLTSQSLDRAPRFPKGDPPSRVGGRTWRSSDDKDIGASRLTSQSLDRVPRFPREDYAPATARRSLLRQRVTPFRPRDGSSGGQYRPRQNDSDLFQKGRPLSSHLRDRGRWSPTKAPTLNRAERRAARFGHSENPPEGYKALPVSGADQHWSESRKESHDWASFRRPNSRERPSVHNRFTAKHYESEDREFVTAPREQGLRDIKEEPSQTPDERPRRKSTAPISIPYTTPASEFLYGHAVVTSALQFSHRKFYKLYLYNGHAAESRGQDNQGYILEASRLPKLPLKGLRSVPVPRSSFEVILDHQSREDEAVNDGIRDPGNVGGIIRSAKFLGADGILHCVGLTAPLTPVALKAAAGAAEALPLFSVNNPSDFIDMSRENGWKFYAAVSPSSSGSVKATGRPYFSTSTLGAAAEKHPCVLILGSEGEGLKWNIQKKADYLVGIEAARTGYGELDSLNVSVAAGLLCDAFLRGPPVTSSRGANQRMLEQAPAASHTEAGFDLGFGDPRIGREISGVGASDQRLF